jgi:hypothetical protein
VKLPLLLLPLCDQQQQQWPSRVLLLLQGAAKLPR